MIWFDVKLGILCLLGAGISFLYYRILCVKQFGGTTGDVAGYFLQICELVMALFVVFGGRLWY
jgi:adenosylcobinamide-GDP ribazoletransferase